MTLREKFAKWMIKCNPSLGDYECGWDQGAEEVFDLLEPCLESVRAKVEYHREAYGLDIFPNSQTITPESTVDSISAKMGRHMCDVFLSYIDESLAELHAKLDTLKNPPEVNASAGYMKGEGK